MNKDSISAERIDNAVQRMNPTARFSPAMLALCGMLALMLAMGIGRFAYTALLPAMLDGHNLNHSQAAWLAAGNYLGYLLGALWAAFSRHANPRWRLASGLALSVATTAAMALPLGFASWLAVRLAAGIASALVYVYSTGMVLRRLTTAGAAGWSTLHYMGVGTGITLSALVAQVIQLPAFGQLNAAWGWWILAAVAMLAALWSARGLLNEERNAAVTTATEKSTHQASTMPLWLATAYGLAGFGYIVNMTYLPLMLHTGLGGGRAAFASWLIVGLTAIPATAWWVRLALRHGTYPVLIACTLTQAVGVALPVLLPGLAAALAGAALLGGTFMGIAGLAQWLARSPDPQTSTRRIGFITMFYGSGQIAGPLLVGWLGHPDNFTLPVLLAAASLLLSAALLLLSRHFEKLDG